MQSTKNVVTFPNNNLKCVNILKGINYNSVYSNIRNFIDEIGFSEYFRIQLINVINDINDMNFRVGSSIYSNHGNEYMEKVYLIWNDTINGIATFSKTNNEFCIIGKNKLEGKVIRITFDKNDFPRNIYYCPGKKSFSNVKAISLEETNSGCNLLKVWQNISLISDVFGGIYKLTEITFNRKNSKILNKKISFENIYNDKGSLYKKPRFLNKLLTNIYNRTSFKNRCR